MRFIDSLHKRLSPKRSPPNTTLVFTPVPLIIFNVIRRASSSNGAVQQLQHDLALAREKYGALQAELDTFVAEIERA